MSNGRRVMCARLRIKPFTAVHEEQHGATEVTGTHGENQLGSSVGHAMRGCRGARCARAGRRVNRADANHVCVSRGLRLPDSLTSPSRPVGPAADTGHRSPPWLRASVLFFS